MQKNTQGWRQTYFDLKSISNHEGGTQLIKVMAQNKYIELSFQIKTSAQHGRIWQRAYGFFHCT